MCLDGSLFKKEPCTCGKAYADLLPVKAHYFFFFAALGPLLPQINVFGRQLGVSPDVMGLVTAVLPILWALAKPLFGFLVDYFQKQRKLIFIYLIITMSGSYCLLYFLPDAPSTTPVSIVDITSTQHQKLNILPLSQASLQYSDDINLTLTTCGWKCRDDIQKEILKTNDSTSDLQDIEEIQFYIVTNNTHLTMSNDLYYSENASDINCDYLYMENSSYNESMVDFNSENEFRGCKYRSGCSLSCALLRNISLMDALSGGVSAVVESEYNLYGSVTFWGFVLFMCVGTVAFNVANSISDAICFDVLGANRSMKYGYQRAWGTIGYGVTALLAGLAVDLVSKDPMKKDFTPAFILTIIFTLVDLFFCRKLELPKASRPEEAGSTLGLLLSRPSVIVFLCFTVIAGMFDSFLIYYLFWFLEELATETGHMGNIKVLEGLTVAVQSFGGELLFFLISGKILKRFGFGKSLTFCLACYGIRFLAISFITNPWQALPLELIMQGPTYALTYSTIVGYAAAVAPPGLSATLQGIVAGMDDGFGFALGSLLGGQLYKYIGGKSSFRFFSGIAFVAAICHAIIVATVFKNYIHKTEEETVKDPNSPESGDLLDKNLTGKIVSFTALEKQEENVRQNLKDEQK